MSQNYKIVERLTREAEIKRAAAMDCYGDRRDTLNREAAEDDEAASLIQELGEALEAISVSFNNTTFPPNSPSLAALNRGDAILSKLKEA